MRLGHLGTRPAKIPRPLIIVLTSIITLYNKQRDRNQQRLTLHTCIYRVNHNNILVKEPTPLANIERKELLQTRTKTAQIQKNEYEQCIM